MIRVASTLATMFNGRKNAALTALGETLEAPDAKPLDGITVQAYINTAAAGLPSAAVAGLPAGASYGMAPDASSGISIGDWDELFHAVEYRLRMTVGNGAATNTEVPGYYAASLVQASVLDCVKAMGQLHTALGLERARLRQLELEITETNTAHALALAKLVLSHRIDKPAPT